MNRLALTSLAVGSALLFSACGSEPEAPTTIPDGAIVVTGMDSLQYDKTEISATAGTVTFALKNAGAVTHNIVIEGEAGDDPIVSVGAQKTAIGEIDLDAGVYTYYCDVSGHRAAGMEGTLTVS